MVTWLWAGECVSVFVWIRILTQTFPSLFRTTNIPSKGIACIFVLLIYFLLLRRFISFIFRSSRQLPPMTSSAPCRIWCIRMRTKRWPLTRARSLIWKWVSLLLASKQGTMCVRACVCGHVFVREIPYVLTLFLCTLVVVNRWRKPFTLYLWLLYISHIIFLH